MSQGILPIVGTLILALAMQTQAQDRWWLLGHSSSRVLGMGGCYVANTRFNEAHRYNPAGLHLKRTKKWWSLSLDPMAPAMASSVEGRDHSPYTNALPALLALRGLWIGNETFALGLSPAEYIPAHDQVLPDRAESASILNENITPALVFSWVLDSRITLGLSGSYLWDEEHLNRRMAVSYGLLVRVNRVVDVGAVAINLSGDGASNDRRWLDRVDDGTINVGLSWFPFGKKKQRKSLRRSSRNRNDLENMIAPDFATVQVSCDVRNVTQEGRGFNNQEVHMGLSLAWPQLLELRGGIYWPRDPDFPDASPVRSVSLGVLRSSLRAFPKRLVPFSTMIDVGWMDNPLASRGEGIWMLGFNLGF